MKGKDNNLCHMCVLVHKISVAIKSDGIFSENQRNVHIYVNNKRFIKIIAIGNEYVKVVMVIFSLHLLNEYMSCFADISNDDDDDDNKNKNKNKIFKKIQPHF